MVRAAMKVKTFVSCRMNAPYLTLPVSRIEICENDAIRYILTIDGRASRNEYLREH